MHNLIVLGIAQRFTKNGMIKKATGDELHNRRVNSDESIPPLSSSLSVWLASGRCVVVFAQVCCV